MNTYKLEEGSRLLAATSWGAIAAGVFVALALQLLLLLLGLAFAVSVGDHIAEGGFAWWGFFVQLAALCVGGALAARVSRASSQLGGMVAGAMTWAVAVVIGGALGGVPLAGAAASELGASGAWAAFFGVLLGLGAALIGGAFGSRRSAGDYEHEDPLMSPATSTMPGVTAPYHHEPV